MLQSRKGMNLSLLFSILKLQVTCSRTIRNVFLMLWMESPPWKLQWLQSALRLRKTDLEICSPGFLKQMLTSEILTSKGVSKSKLRRQVHLLSRANEWQFSSMDGSCLAPFPLILSLINMPYDNKHFILECAIDTQNVLCGGPKL